MPEFASSGGDLTPSSAATGASAPLSLKGEGGEGRCAITRSTTIMAEQLERARGFRKAPSRAEAAAWELLRARRCLGLKFRRQQIIEGFYADFYCAERRLVLEIDGAIHDDPEQAAYDAARTS